MYIYGAYFHSEIRTWLGQHQPNGIMNLGYCLYIMSYLSIKDEKENEVLFN